MHRKLEDVDEVAGRAPAARVLTSTDPATGEIVWSGEVGNASTEVAAAGPLLVACWHRDGMPDGVVRRLIVGPDEARALAGEAGSDGLLFTGSARAGMALHRQFAETPHKILALELGGNNPLVVWGAKHIDAAATIAVQSAYLTAGQRCTAARRLIVEDGHEGELLAEIQELIDRIIVDEP